MFLNGLNKPPSDIGKLFKDEKHVFGYKGYGTPELEMKYLHNIFQYIQASHSELESFSWQQGNQYNDEYHHFMLMSFTVNEKLDVDSDLNFSFENHDEAEISSTIHFDSIEYPDPVEIEYAKENNIEVGEEGLDQTYWDAFWEWRKNKYQHLEIPCLKILAVLRLLEMNFSMYYFLYTFGNGVEVKLTKNGLTVTKLNENETGGKPLGTGMDLGDL